MSKQNRHLGSSINKFNANIPGDSSPSGSSSGSSGSSSSFNSQDASFEDNKEVQVTRSGGSGLNATPGIGAIGGPVMYARTLRPGNIESFLSGKSKLTNSMEELMLSNDDDVVIVLKRETTVQPEKWATQGIGANSLKELQERGFDIDHVYQNTINGQKVSWTLKANIDGTYTIVNRGNTNLRGAIGHDAGSKNSFKLKGLEIESFIRSRAIKPVI